MAETLKGRVIKSFRLPENFIGSQLSAKKELSYHSKKIVNFLHVDNFLSLFIKLMAEMTIEHLYPFYSSFWGACLDNLLLLIILPYHW
jgi:hypothetical protein